MQVAILHNNFITPKCKLGSEGPGSRGHHRQDAQMLINYYKSPLHIKLEEHILTIDKSNWFNNIPKLAGLAGQGKQIHEPLHVPKICLSQGWFLLFLKRFSSSNPNFELVELSSPFTNYKFKFGIKSVKLRRSSSSSRLGIHNYPKHVFILEIMLHHQHHALYPTSMPDNF